MVRNEQIYIDLTNRVKGLDLLNKQNKALEKIGLTSKLVGTMLQNLGSAFNNAGRSHARYAQNVISSGKQVANSLTKNMVMEQSQSEVLAQSIARRTGANIELVKSQRSHDAMTRQQTRSNFGLTMGYLSVMFAGMALNRAMGGLVRTSLEWVGITELMSEALGVFFLPVAMDLLEILFPILEWFMEAPDWVKKTVGWFVILAAGLGWVAMVVGQVGLALGGLAQFQFGRTILSVLGIGDAAGTASGKVGTLRRVLGKVVGVAVGISIAWAGFEFIRSGIDEGSLVKEIAGVIAMGAGIAATALALGAGIGGAAIGFTLGVGIGLIVSWFIKENKWRKKAESMGISDEAIAQHAWEGTALGAISKFAKTSGVRGLTTQDLEIASVDMAMSEGSGFTGFAVGGIVPENGLFRLHKGEEVLRPEERGSSGGITVSPTYYINVSDKREMEKMMQENNIKLTQEIRRQIRV